MPEQPADRKRDTVENEKETNHVACERRFRASLQKYLQKEQWLLVVRVSLMRDVCKVLVEVEMLGRRMTFRQSENVRNVAGDDS